MKRLIVGISFALLVANTVFGGEVKKVQIDLLAKTSFTWDGRRLPDYSKGTPEITILRIKIPPGAELPPHEHPVINAGVLVSGELTVVTEDGKTLHLKAGEPIVEVVSKRHYGRNQGNKTAEILVFYAGVQDMPITLKE